MPAFALNGPHCDRISSAVGLPATLKPVVGRGFARCIGNSAVVFAGEDQECRLDIRVCAFRQTSGSRVGIRDGDFNYASDTLNRGLRLSNERDANETEDRQDDDEKFSRHVNLLCWSDD